MKFTLFEEASIGIHPSWWSWGWRLGLASWLVIGGAIISVDCAFGQLAPDGTLTNNSTVTPQDKTAPKVTPHNSWHPAKCHAS